MTLKLPFQIVYPKSFFIFLFLVSFSPQPHNAKPNPECIFLTASQWEGILLLPLVSGLVFDRRTSLGSAVLCVIFFLGLNFHDFAQVFAKTWPGDHMTAATLHSDSESANTLVVLPLLPPAR